MEITQNNYEHKISLGYELWEEENHTDFSVGNPVLSRQKFHAKQMFVLSSSMKLGPGAWWLFNGKKPNSKMIFLERQVQRKAILPLTRMNA